ncbi:MAG: ammonium transporter [Verrucomicrobiota bacterium]
MKAALIVFLLLLGASALPAQETASAPPTLEERVRGLEANMKLADPTGTTAEGVPDAGTTAWMMTSTALVLFMTLPGLALFYGGLVRDKNVLSILAICLGCTGLVTILWWLAGYSLVYGTSFNSPVIGGLDFAFLNGVGSTPNPNYADWLPHSVLVSYQLAFAIITASLIFGSTAERIKFNAVLCFVGLWMFLVYFPLAHMVWGFNGLMNGADNAQAAIPSLDFAGGMVVHMSSGWSGLVLCIFLGRRHGYGLVDMRPHSPVLCMVGTGMLWLGWYGFNAGSEWAANGIAANAVMTTTLAAATGSFVWASLEALHRGKPTVVGFCSGAVSGLVVITPACGYVSANGAMLVGLIAGMVPYYAVDRLKRWFRYDDALDAFGIHGVGGTIGSILVGFLADPAVNPNLVTATTRANGLAAAVEGGYQWWYQLQAVGLTVALAVVGSTIIALFLRSTLGLRTPPEHEEAGLDLAVHGESGYSFVGRRE